MFDFLSSKKSVSPATLVFDIGSKSVGGAVFEKTPSGKARLVYVSREAIDFSANLTGEKLQAAMLASLRAVMAKLDTHAISRARSEKHSIHHFQSVAVILSSPWHASETKLLSLQFGKSALVTKAVIDNLVAEEEKSFEKKLSKGQTGAEFEVVERKIIDMRINGYSTAKPYGKTANSIEVVVFESVAPAVFVRALKAAIAKKFPSDNIEFHTFSSAALVSLREFFPETEDFLIVQVDGEITDVSVVKSGVIIGSASFPLGHNGLLRSLSKICENHPNCAVETLISMYKTGAGAREDEAKVERAIAETKAGWLGQFDSVISNFSYESFLPKSVFLFEDGPYAPLFEKFLAEFVSDRFTATAEPFAVKAIGEKFAPAFADFPKGVSPDAMLALESSFVARLSK